MNQVGNNFTVRDIVVSDLVEIRALFYNTVHQVNLRDYTQDQLDAWAPAESIQAPYFSNLLDEGRKSIVACDDNRIVGFGDITFEGYLDRLFVHHEYQRKGVSTLLVSELEKFAKAHQISIITTEVSITAKPFFIHVGYEVMQEQRVEKRGVYLNNFKMQKII